MIYAIEGGRENVIEVLLRRQEIDLELTFCAKKSMDGDVIEGKNICKYYSANINERLKKLSRDLANFKETALMVAIRTGSLEIVKKLIDKGTSVDDIQNLVICLSCRKSYEESNPDVQQVIADISVLILFTILKNKGVKEVSEVLRMYENYLPGIDKLWNSLTEFKRSDSGVVSNYHADGLLSASLFLFEGGVSSLFSLALSKVDVDRNICVCKKNGVSVDPNLIYMSDNNKDIKTSRIFDYLIQELKYPGDTLLLILVSIFNSRKLIWIVKNNTYDEAIVEQINEVIVKGASVNIYDNNRCTPLMYAARNKIYKAVKILVECGADVNLQNQAGETALIIADKSGDEEIVRFLIDAGASVDQQDKEGNTALIYAAIGNHLEVAKHLVDSGANINIKNKCGKMALLLVSKGGDSIYKLLFGVYKKEAEKIVENVVCTTTKISVSSSLSLERDAHNCVM